MRNQTINQLPRHSALAACLGAALGLTSTAAMSGLAQRTDPRAVSVPDISSVVPAYLRLRAAKAEAENPNHPTAPHQVDNCNDDGPGSLRAVIGDPGTISGDSVELTGMAMTCSTITLASAIHVTQDTLHIHGPGADQLTIDGDHASRVFYHTGAGTLGITDVTIANGTYVDSGGGLPSGGCLYSSGSILLIGSVVTHCLLQATASTDAAGAGVYARGYLTLFESTVSQNHGMSTTTASAFGGGAYAIGNFAAVYSAISGNYLTVVNQAHTAGGGVLAKSNTYIAGSTISGNSAEYYGGIGIEAAMSTATIVNSTVSGNKASGAGGGGIFSTVPLTLASSTVAFNTTNSNAYSAGVQLSNTTLSAQSSIIANNSRPDGENDLGGSGMVDSGSQNNLVVKSSIPLPANTIIGTCPQLDVLANNGGSTLTHGLKAASPAIDKGAPGTLVTDQRGAQRVFPDNGLADIGAVEWQPTDKPERLLASGFDGVCDL